MFHAFGVTPHFMIRVWGSPGATDDRLRELLRERRRRVPIALIEVDTIELRSLTISPHRGLDFINQKMLTP